TRPLGTGASPRGPEKSRSWSYQSGVRPDEEEHGRKQRRAETSAGSSRTQAVLVGGIGCAVAVRDTDCPGRGGGVLAVETAPGPAEFALIDHGLEHPGSDRAASQLRVLAGCAGRSRW